MPEMLDSTRLGDLLTRMVALRDRLSQDERKVDALVQHIRDEAWQADVRDAMPDGTAEDAYRLAARELWQTIDHELERLRTQESAVNERKPK